MNQSAPYAGVICPHHGNVDIDQAEYIRQMMRPNMLWVCPKCGTACQFDDERYEELNFPEED